MKKRIFLLVLIGMLLMSSLTGFAEEAAAAPEPTDAPQAAEAPGDNLVTTKHTARIQGQELAYTATTGTMALETGGETCEVFFTAYTLDGAEDPSTRPVTFAFNGGPGSCSMFLHVGCLGPRRIDVDDNGYTPALPTGLSDNENSLLDLTDLVIIDAMGTGYSRPAGDSELSAFIGYDNDIRTFGDFIYQYVNRYGRWGSGKYVAGESYGTTRAVGLCQYLADAYSMNLNGLMLISSVNDFSALIFADGNETPYALYIPTFAADAWYHGLVAEAYRDMALEDYLTEVRSFVEKEYVPALFMGNALSEADKDAVAGKLADYTGLKKDYVLGRNLRVALDDFCTELLDDKGLTVGRYDGRITGPKTSGSLDDGTSDPSNAAFQLGYGNTYNDYLANELGYRTDRPYVPSDNGINNAWDFPIGGWGGYLSQERTVYECMSKNAFLKVWVLCGYYDAATPFYSAEWVYRHVFLDDAHKDNLSFTYYPCGHMIYMEKASFDKFRRDAEAWYK
ncbi:MAG: peptidase S10 [Clostridia bacterium]|nr:peptidase S10 [Clostridia bacterium]